MTSEPMNRRKALRALALGGVGAAAGPAWVEELCNVAASLSAQSAPPAAASTWSPAVLTPHHNETVIVLSELIIPQTETAGAKAARVNEFIDAVLADARAPEREQFLRGLAWLDARSKEVYGAVFVETAPLQQTAILASIGSPDNQAPADRIGVELFRAVKTLTITGYYTSQIGMREELGDDGRLVFPDYVGCVHAEHKKDALERPSGRTGDGELHRF